MGSWQMNRSNNKTVLPSLQDCAFELLARLRAQLSRAHHPAPSWELRRADLERTEIIWPRRYVWKAAANWAESIRRGLRRYVKLRTEDVEQNVPGLIRFIVNYGGGQALEVAIDYSDRLTIDQHLDGQFDIYFKLQFDTDGYDSSRILPGGFVSYPLLYDVWSIVDAISNRWEKKYDVFGRFSVDFATEVRTRAVHILSEGDNFEYEGGLVKKRYMGYLYDICKSQICIDLPGNGPFCFRLIDYLAMGACVIAFPHATKLHVPIKDGEHIVYVKEDLSDLEDKCLYYLQNSDERRRIGRNARALFVDFLHREQLAAYYLHEIYKRRVWPRKFEPV